MTRSSSSAHGLRLSQVIPQGQWFFVDEEPSVQSCSLRADQCQPGDLFVVLDDDTMLEQDVIGHAIERGACALLAERPLPASVPQFLVDDCRVATGQICHALAEYPCRSLRTIGITGTYGKTTVDRLLQGMLRHARLTSQSMDAGLLELHGPTYFARWLAETRAAGDDVAIIEASSRVLSQHLLSGTQLDAAVLTNIRREHAELHGSLRNYQAAKARLLEYLKPGGIVVANADDPTCRAIIEATDLPTLTYGLHQPAEVTASVLERHCSEQTFLIEAGDESIAVRTPIIGDGHIANCLAAAAVGLVMGLDLHAIVRGLEALQEIPGRLQRVECGQKFSVFVDYSHTPHALNGVLSTLRQVTQRNLMCVLGVDHRQSDSARAQTGRTLERLCDKTVLTASRWERPMSQNAAHDVLDGFDRPAQAHMMPNRTRAICWALAQAQEGDVVVIAGGRRPTGESEDEITDADVAQYWLRQAQGGPSCPWLPA